MYWTSDSAFNFKVYKATIRKDRLNTPHKWVAVKVRHPGIEHLIRLDLEILGFFARIVDKLPTMKWLNLPQEVTQFSEIMEKQLDLRYEALNLFRFKWNFEKENSVSFPIPLFPLVSSEVMVESFEEGIPISKFILPKKIENDECARSFFESFNEKIVSIGFNSFLKMLLLDNFVHADLHPGNIYVQFIERKRRSWWRKEKSSCDFPFESLYAKDSADIDFDKLKDLILEGKYEVRLLYLDAGLVSSLASSHFDNFLDLFKELILYHNGYEVGKMIVERSKQSVRLHNGRLYNPFVVDEIGFYNQMQSLVDNAFGKQTMKNSLIPSFKLRDLQLSQILMEVFRLVRLHHVKLDEEYTNLVMSLVCVEGLGRQLVPKSDLMPFMRNAGMKYLVNRTAQILPAVVQV